MSEKYHIADIPKTYSYPFPLEGNVPEFVVEKQLKTNRPNLRALQLHRLAVLPDGRWVIVALFDDCTNGLDIGSVVERHLYITDGRNVLERLSTATVSEGWRVLHLNLEEGCIKWLEVDPDNVSQVTAHSYQY